ncbi:hypothetical protein BYT27DRAFT_7189242 [Phlegmacium glaucopus]|nr:hypothetical protein BYT27DRAFT_7189242 [Phlegmacium glaucopus]
MMGVPVAYNDGTSHLDLKQSESPLANLVRRTSSRRRKGPEQSQQLQQTAESPDQYAYYPSQQSYDSYYNDDSIPPTKSNDGTQPLNQQMKLYLDIERTHSTATTPHSPLLHSHFARDSIATASSYDDNSYLYTDTPGVRSSMISRDIYEDRLGSSPDNHSDYDYFEDDRNVHLGATSGGPSLRDSWRSTDTDATFPKPENFATSRHLSNDLHPPSSQQEQHLQVEGHLSPVSLPSVLVSLHDPPINNIVDAAAIRDGHIPVVKPVANLSRPIHEAGQPEHAGAMGERVTPQLPPDMREQKLKVLERNARRGMARSSSPGGSMKSRSPLSQTSMYIDGSVSVQNGSNSGWSQSHENVQLQAEAQQRRSSSPLTTNSYPQPPPMVSPNANLHPQSRSSDTGTRSLSLYSAYSYYEYENAAPSPTGSQPSSRPAEVGSMSRSEQLQRPLSSTRSSPNAPSQRLPEGLRTPQEFLQLGIQHHEANRLQESARCFERSAIEGGGCGVGMLMYGLTLRHGWGCAKNEKAGFKWLRKAAEYAVEDLERVRMNGDMDVKVIETELVLAIYEVGQCFFHGWGVAKDQKMAVSYYTVAARLGDGDAQVDLGFCLANGKGCKKDKKSAARWYRAAVSQGQSDVGLAWIYKQKYLDQV